MFLFPGFFCANIFSWQVYPEDQCVRFVRSIRMNTWLPLVSLAGMEKLIAIIQLIQLYALVLLLSEAPRNQPTLEHLAYRPGATETWQEWKLPYNWRIWINWTMVFIFHEPIDKLDFQATQRRPGTAFTH